MTDDKTFDDMIQAYNKILSRYKQNQTTENLMALEMIKTAIQNELNERQRNFYRVFDRQQGRV